MGALQRADIPDALRDEVVRLYKLGYPLLPLGNGVDGKAPFIGNWASKRVSLGQVLAILHRKGSRTFGVRLDSLAVVDCDSAEPEMIAAMEARFGPSSVHVRTPRGYHLYYARPVGKLPNLRGEGLPVDIKAGAHHYVAGPFSERPDGGRYVPIKGSLGGIELPRLLLPKTFLSEKSATSQKVPEGKRHQDLLRLGRALAQRASDFDSLFAELLRIRDSECENPYTIPDSEVAGIARWVWRLRLENRLYVGRDSEFRFPRAALDTLRGKVGGSDAIALLVLLLSEHGHQPGKTFALDHKGMRSAGLTDLSRERFAAARRLLEESQFLGTARNHMAGVRSRRYRLLKGPLGPLQSQNVERLPNDGAGGARVYD